MTEQLKTGTTTLGLCYKGGVVLGTESRATMGTLIAHKTTQKLFRIDNNIGLTMAGLVGDAQTLARYLEAEVSLYKLKRGAPMSIRAASTLMANILSGRSYYPYWVQLIIGGFDIDGPHVYSLDAAGGSIEDIYVSTGSGSPYVYGVLEDYFKKDMDEKGACDLAVRAISAAKKRDSASGNAIQLASISNKGFRQFTDDEIEKITHRLGV
jgi:proteasome beta subunit